MSRNYRPYTLGLDIGIASVGAALLAEDEIIALHVRTFDKAENPKTGEALNKIRREARSNRHRLQRKSQRLRNLRHMFMDIGMTESMGPNEFAQPCLSTWQLRYEGLDRHLLPLEWAAVIYHIVKHRGFQSSRKDATKETNGTPKGNDPENKRSKTTAMLDGVNNNKELLNKYRTVGEMIYMDPKFKSSKRNKGGDYSHTISRAELVSEVDTLFTKQAELGNTYATKDIKDNVMKILLARKPALTGVDLLKMVGKCTLEPNEKRVPRACYTTQQFIWLDKINNLMISKSGERIGLSQQQKEILANLPFELSSVSYKQIRNKLNLESDWAFIGLNASSKGDPEKAICYEAKSYHDLRRAYETDSLSILWERDRHDAHRLDTLAYALTVYKEEDEIITYLSKAGIEDEITNAVLEITTINFTKFKHLSLKALNRLIPEMKNGKRYDEAVIAAGYNNHYHPNETTKTKYIHPISKDDITNPVVYRALNQSRKMVNAIVKEYGPPSMVCIELARDLSKPFKERQEIEKEQKKYQERKNILAAEFQENFPDIEYTGLSLEKYRLYKEQNGQCPYCQKGIDCDRLFEDGYTQIDHILPWARSFCNQKNNKVLVCANDNQNKRNQTPYEFLSGATNSEKWQTFEAWVKANAQYTESKKHFLLRKDFDKEASKKFKDRNLTDTRYICTKFKQMIEDHLQLAESSNRERGVVVSGQMTAFLRAKWGLVKSRDDGDLHHALDAAVVAATTPGMVKRLAEYSKHNLIEYAKDRTTFPQPWEGFRQELLARLSQDPTAALPHLASMNVQPIRVSRAPQRRGTGAAHKDTIHSPKYLDSQRTFKTTALQDLELKDLPNIIGYDDPRNRALMDALRSRLLEFNDKGKDAFKDPFYRPMPSGKEHLAPLVKSVKLFESLKSGIPLTKRGGGIASNEDMLRSDIFTKDGKFYVIPLYVSDLTRSELPNRIAVSQKPESEWPIIDESYEFLFSLHKNDWIKITFKDSSIIEGYYNTFDRSSLRIKYFPHDKRSDSNLKRASFSTTVLIFEKYHIDILGHLYKVDKEIRKALQ